MIIFLCKYCIVTLVTLTDLWICFSFCSLEYYHSIIINQEEKIEFLKRVHRRICVRDITFLAAGPLSYVIFVAFFVYCVFYVEKVVLLRKTVAVGGEGGGTGTPCALSFSGPELWRLSSVRILQQIRNILVTKADSQTTHRSKKCTLTFYQNSFN